MTTATKTTTTPTTTPTTKTAAKTANPERRSVELHVREVMAEDRRIVAYASTAHMDRHGTVIEPKAFKATMKEFMRNPVVYGSHMPWYESGEPPVFAKVVDYAIDDEGLLVTIEFARGGQADVWWERYRDGFMRALSVGFRPLAHEMRQREDKSGEYVVYTKVELHEISLVGVPSNRESLVRRAMEGDADAARTVIGDLSERVGTLERELANTMERIEDEGFSGGFSGGASGGVEALRGRVSAVEKRIARMSADLDTLLASDDAPTRTRRAQAPTPSPTCCGLF